MRILFVEDDARIARKVKAVLEEAGYAVDSVGDGETAWFQGDTEEYDLAILDLGLPKMDGLSVLKKWRGAGRDLPVLILTARGAWAERVEGIDAGADDYLTKPFNNSEFLARVRALLRRPADVLGPIIEVGNTAINLANLEVSCEGRPVDLRFSERRLLALLMRRSGQLVPKSALETSLSEFGRDVSSNAIEALISRTRRALVESGSNLAIETVRGVGYALKGPAG